VKQAKRLAKNLLSVCALCDDSSICRLGEAAPLLTE
jgi:hypothetical protein